ncbi:putative nuclease HARBI1 [Cucumis melo var. makuwa]|uniref:Putative nuclease HARBI1 n=1 Tax=Cucumis melo var. makuwa TaxID=1194695 RepID=A0A5D3CBA8_CUCMM|nr:putative nuclease HARBI1 [Cucumis melo var. makuwa]
MTARRATKETTASNQHLYRSTVEVLQNCFGALEGTYIKVNVQIDRPIYRMHKGKIATNVLEVCDTKCDFVFVLAGWEGSTGDSCILRDAFARPNGLQVSKGIYNFYLPRHLKIRVTAYNPLSYVVEFYYLCDMGYSNTEGFLTPYRGQRYHLQECRGAGNAPTTAKEYFNMKHSSA